MRRRGDVVMGGSHLSSTRQARRGLSEAVLAAQFEFECRVGGAERLAYPSVVAGGENATVLHYMHNDATVSYTHLTLPTILRV